MKLDLAINGAQIVTLDAVVQGCVGIASGKVVAIRPEPFGGNSIDAAGRVLLPGLVDPHCHFWDPGATDREDWSHGTAAAAAGGVTTVIEMPLSIPPTIDAKAFGEKMAVANAESHVDFMLWGGVIPAAEEQVRQRMRELTHLGAAGFKIFMCRAADEFPASDFETLTVALAEASRLGVIVAIHAESSDIIDELEPILKREGRSDPLAYARSRPKAAELQAIDDVLHVASETKTTLYFVHTSIADGARRIAQAKRANQDAYVETCPHYLTLNDSDLRELGPWAKCAPPLRDAGEVEDLWTNVMDGTIDTIASDHAPFTYQEKLRGVGDIWNAPNGLTGLQTMLPLLIDEGIHRRALTFPRLTQLTSEAASRLFGLYPRKGTIAVGSDADLVLVDPAARWTVRGASMLQKAKWTPYEGRTIHGRVDMTMVRGVPVYRDGEVQVAAGHGKFLHGR